MVKANPMQITKEQKNNILAEAEKENEFDYMFFLTLATTGRRLGELYGVEEKKETGRRVIGKKVIYIQGKRAEVDRTIPIYKKTNIWKFGVKVKDLNFEAGTMKVWVLKRRNYIQDETILMPETARVINSYIKRNRLRLEDYVFRTKGRKYRQIENKIKYYAHKAGIKTEIDVHGMKYNLSIHSFRHYFITELKRNGWTNDQIMKMTGHKTPAVLSIYDHVLATDIKEKALETLKEL